MSINAFCADISIKNGKAIKKLFLDNKYKAAVAICLRPPLLTVSNCVNKALFIHSRDTI